MKHPFSKIFGQSEKEIPEEENVQGQVQDVPVSEIIPNRYQPRTVFNDQKIEELAETIQTHGIIQPIVLRKTDDKYEIIAGERRWRAVSLLQWEKVPAIIKSFDDEQTAAVALIENLQREDLTAIEEAMAYAKLIDIHGLTQESLAQSLGKGQSTVANKLRLLKLPSSVQNALLEKNISERHARALIALKDPEKQDKLLAEILEKHLNVKQTEDRVKTLLEGNDKAPKEKQKKRQSLSRDMRIAVNTIRQSVDMVVDSGLNIDTNEEDMDEYYQFTIRIPKK
ncbi:ParB family chromosome partitioning protein [Scopulibacillus darangshiensis]|uniref:ParB family chromosome partitioning protein n=1 Tax=Scopulibacillus darangshiensis TaxID=442528 RepID=A0A4V2SKL7_9BACL|nr:nucleoid occlusion protein [Scopulibacillus darangshiensis]TCP20016.1 ParB family chromosome partitioning protein [Scopulibacillus darangshiensis]